jgi:hypothetical protein
MRKMTALTLVMIMIFSLASCGGETMPADDGPAMEQTENRDLCAIDGETNTEADLRIQNDLERVIGEMAAVEAVAVSILRGNILSAINPDRIYAAITLNQDISLEGTKSIEDFIHYTTGISSENIMITFSSNK